LIIKKPFFFLKGFFKVPISKSTRQHAVILERKKETLKHLKNWSINDHNRRQKRYCRAGNEH
jgi:hypothetical protein